MAGNSNITEGYIKTFYFLLCVIASIVGSSILGFKYLSNENEKAIEKALAPFVSDLNEYKQKYVELEDIMNKNCDGLRDVQVSMTYFLDYYNKKHNTTFLKPSDIELTETHKNKRRR